MRWMSVVILVSLVANPAAAEPGRDTVMADGHVYLSYLGAMAGGSIHVEHRLADSPYGLTLRASGSSGSDRDGRDFEWFAGLVGARRHWDATYLEAEVGWAGHRQERTTDDLDPAVHYGVEWHDLPDLQITFGHRFGPIDLGVFTQVPAAGLGLHLGLALD